MMFDQGNFSYLVVNGGVHGGANDTAIIPSLPAKE
jgi:hypothetical protein